MVEEVKSIGYGFCVNCEKPSPLTKHGACATCGSESIVPRASVGRKEPEPHQEQQRDEA